MAQKLHSMQDTEDSQQLALRQLSQQLPEVSKRLEELWAQCQLYFPRPFSAYFRPISPIPTHLKRSI